MTENDNELPPGIIETLDAAKALMDTEEADDAAIVSRYEQARAAADALPEEERVAARDKAWRDFARANQRQHERRQRALKALLDGTMKG